jgi:hypothetical protein
MHRPGGILKRVVAFGNEDTIVKLQDRILHQSKRDSHEKAFNPKRLIWSQSIYVDIRVIEMTRLTLTVTFDWVMISTVTLSTPILEAPATDIHKFSPTEHLKRVTSLALVCVTHFFLDGDYLPEIQ